MNKKLCCILLILPMSMVVNFPVVAESSLGDIAEISESSTNPIEYSINPGDVLEISVWKEESLNKQALVRPDGGITFPLIGNIHAGGKSVGELKKNIIEKLATFIPDPVVTVSIVSIGLKVYVLGKVNKPGEFQPTHNIDVMQALSMAGGLTPFADDDDIKILRRMNGDTKVLLFDYGAILDGQRLDQNIVLESGDVVVVP